MLSVDQARLSLDVFDKPLVRSPQGSLPVGFACEMLVDKARDLLMNSKRHIVVVHGRRLSSYLLESFKTDVEER